MISITPVNTIKKHSEVFSVNARVYSRWCTTVGWFCYVATGNSIVGLSCHSNRFQSLDCSERRKFLLKHPVKSTLILLPLGLYSAIHVCIYIPVNYIKVTLKTATEWLLKPNKWNKTTKNTRAYLHWKKWVRALLTRAILQNIQEGISNGVFFVCFLSIFSTVFSCLPAKGFSFPFALRRQSVSFSCVFVKVWTRVHDWESLSDLLQVGVALLEVGVVREGINVFLDHFVAELILLLWGKAGCFELRRTWDVWIKVLETR